MYCKICGDVSHLGKPRRFWSPDDGWLFGRLCRYCASHYGKRQPKSDDYAYREHRRDYCSDDDSYIDAFCG